MGLYIKDVSMPKHCIDCPFMISRDNDDCILQSEEMNENAKTWDDLKANCPLVEVGCPTHNAGNNRNLKCGIEGNINEKDDEGNITDFTITGFGIFN